MANEAIILDMDKEREIKWTFGAMKVFEKRAKEVLKRLGTKDTNGRLFADSPADMRALLAFLPISEVLEAAVGAVTGLSTLDEKDGSPSEAAQAIDAYLGRGGDIESLHHAIWKAFFVVKNPSALPIWEAEIDREKERRQIEQEKKDADMRILKAQLQEKLLKANATETAAQIASGKMPTESPTQS